MNINKECEIDKAYPEGVTDCDDCEFLTEDSVGCIGGMTGMSMGNRKRCEQGYWKEEV